MQNNINLDPKMNDVLNIPYKIQENTESQYWNDMKIKLEKVWSHTINSEREIRFTGQIVSCWIDKLLDGKLIPGKLYTLNELTEICDYEFPENIDKELATVHSAFNASGFPSHLFEAEFWLRDDNYLPNVKIDSSNLRLMNSKKPLYHPKTNKLILEPEDKIFIEFRVMEKPIND
jgi:hypothetical protein